METNTSPVIDKVVQGLKKAAEELEEFHVQVALGKAEALDKYEELKKTVDESIHSLKEKVLKHEKAQELKGKLEELKLQFHLGKAETMDGIKEQKKRIGHGITEIENLLRGNKQ
jgi:hypothetical protein